LAGIHDHKPSEEASMNKDTNYEWRGLSTSTEHEFKGNIRGLTTPGDKNGTRTMLTSVRASAKSELA
jgi:hypothetical protein